MDEISFLVQGSVEAPYELSFRKSGNNIIALCTCKAAMNGQHCKHRIEIFKGFTNNIVSKNEEKVKTVQSWLHGSNVESLLNEVEEAESALESAKKSVSILKKKLARAMLGDDV